MSALADVSPIMALLAAACLLAGAVFALIGSVGLVRLRSFYERVHPPTLGTTFGTGLVGLGSMIVFSALESRPVLHELALIVLVVVTTPITYTLLVRAAFLRASEDARSSRISKSDTPTC